MSLRSRWTCLMACLWALGSINPIVCSWQFKVAQSSGAAPAPGANPTPDGSSADAMEKMQQEGMSAHMPTKELACSTCAEQVVELGLTGKCDCQATTVTGTF